MSPIESVILSSPPMAARAVRSAADDPHAVNWDMTDYIDHGAWALWRLLEHLDCAFDSADLSLCRIRGRTRANNAFGSLESEVFGIREESGPISIEVLQSDARRPDAPRTPRILGGA